MRALFLIGVVLSVPAAAQIRGEEWGALRTIPHPMMYDLAGKVRVIDGDTIAVQKSEQIILGDRLYPPEIVRVRLIGLDAPEKGEPGADRATAMLERMVANSNGRLSCLCGPNPPSAKKPVNECKTDKYGRTLAVCFTDGGSDVARSMIMLGYARARYDCRYEAEEKAPRAANRGLWPGLGDIPTKCHTE